MIFITLAIVAVVLYILDYKIPALFLFFFFFTSGFNLIPEEIIEFSFISRGSDYAFIILFGIIFIDSFCVKNYLKPDTMLKYILLFGAFLLVAAFYSKFSVGLTWLEIFRTCRYQLFWMAYFVFRNMEKAQLERLLVYLFNVTVICAILFILQIFIGTNIMPELFRTKTQLFGMTIPRFYNHPDMLNFFVMMALYRNPHQGMWKITTSILLTAALLGAFHRSLFGCFMLTVFVGYVIQLPRLQRIRILAVTFLLVSFIVVFAGYKFVHSKTYTDMHTALTGDFSSLDLTDIEDLNDFTQGTFSFRIGHLLERNQYILEHPKAMLLGAGLIPEDSKKVDSMFDFKVGLLAKAGEKTEQITTMDISYSMMLIWQGYLGTALNMLLFIYMMVFYYRNKENKYALFSFLYWVLSLGVSLFSANLWSPVTYVMPLISYCIIKKMKEETC